MDRNPALADDTTLLMPTVVSVATINLGNGLADDRRLVAALRAMQVDVFALQELNFRQAEVLRRELEDTWPYQHTFGDGFAGRGVFSQLPMRRAEAIEISTGRPDGLAELDVDGVTLTILVGHPRPPKLRGASLDYTFASYRQVMKLADLAMCSSPAVLLGDFNMHATNPVYRKLEARGLVDAFKESGEGPQRTFPARLGNAKPRLGGRHMQLRVPPMLRLDYIWHTPDVRSVATWVGPDVGSDHLPVISRLAVPRGTGENPIDVL